MAFTPLEGFCTGFEMGAVPFAAALCNGTASTTQKKTGSYSLRLSGGNTLRTPPIPGSISEAYTGLWFYNNGVNWRLCFYLDDGNMFYVSNITGFPYLRIYNASNVLVATGITPISDNVWYNLQAKFLSQDNGIFQVYIDGVEDVTFNGDTKPASSIVIDYMYIYNVGGAYLYIDDLVVGTDAYPGDIRFDVLTPTADTATIEWDNSTGLNAYALVDEIPPDDADYIYTGVTDEDDIFECSDWDGTGKSALFVTAWIKARKNEAAAHQVTILQVEGVSTKTDTKDLTTDYLYYGQLETTAPDGTAWNDAHVDALQIGVRSVIAVP